MSPRAIGGVLYGRDGWHADTMFVQQAPEGEIEITTPMMIIRLGAKQADALLEELRAFREAEEIPEFSPAEQQRLHELAERLTWTCEGCGGKLIGGRPPRCIGCRIELRNTG